MPGARTELGRLKTFGRTSADLGRTSLLLATFTSPIGTLGTVGAGRGSTRRGRPSARMRSMASGDERRENARL